MPRTAYVSVDERRAICAKDATLNGKPAIISGVHTMFASVRTADGRMCGDWQWHAVREIVETHGAAFRI